MIITISGKAEHGKTATANILKEMLEKKGYKCLVMNFADRLKYMAKTYFGWNGKKDIEGRTLLQWLGTEYVRSRDPDFWVNSIISDINILDDLFDYFIIADCRFSNEVNCFKELGEPYISIQVKRLKFENSLTEEQRSHPSETELDNFEFDYIIESESGLNNLEIEVNKFFMKYCNMED